jgi:hypothetical protein
MSAGNSSLVPVIGSDNLCVIQKSLFIVLADIDRYQRSIISIDCPNTTDTKDHLRGVEETIFGVN